MDIGLNEDHDIFVTNSDLVVTTEDNSVIQSLKIRLQFITMEWFLDQFAGLPYPGFILERGTNISAIYTL